MKVKDIKAMLGHNLAGKVVRLQDVHPQGLPVVLHLLHQEATTGRPGDGHGGVPDHQAVPGQHLAQAQEQQLQVLLVVSDG